MSSRKIESFDLSKKAIEIINWRNARRKELREQYLRQTLNPVKQELVMDVGIKRFAIMRLTHEIRANLNGRSAVFGLGFTLGTIILVINIYGKEKAKLENLYRTGQVSYADRDYKFQ